MKSPLYLKVTYGLVGCVAVLCAFVLYDYHANVLSMVPTTPAKVENSRPNANDVLTKLKQMQSGTDDNAARKPSEAERWDAFTKDYDRQNGRPRVVYCTDPRKGTFCPN